MLKSSLADNSCVLKGKVLFLEMKRSVSTYYSLSWLVECLCLEVERGVEFPTGSSLRFCRG